MRANRGVRRKFESFVGNLGGFAPPPEKVNFRHCPGLIVGVIELIEAVIELMEAVIGLIEAVGPN